MSFRLPGNINICSTYILQSLVLLFQLRVDLHESLLRLVKLILDGLDLLLKGTSLFLGLRESRHVSIFFHVIVNYSNQSQLKKDSVITRARSRANAD